MSEIRQAYLVGIDEADLRAFLRERHSCLRDEPFVIVRMEERSWGGLDVWITTPAADKSDAPRTDPFSGEVVAHG